MKRIGTELELKADERDYLLSELNVWRDKARDFFDNRKEYEKAFYCLWDGQEVDGTVHSTDREMAWPFDGASDQRVRWGEKICMDFTSLIVLALQRCEVEFTCGNGGEAETRAHALKKLLNWEMNKIGAKGYSEILALIHFMLVDTPAVAAMDVEWRKRTTLGVVQTTLEEIQEKYVVARMAEGYVSDADARIEFQNALAYVLGEGLSSDDLESDILEEIFNRVQNWLVQSGVRSKDVKPILKALDEEGECEFLQRMDSDEGPELKALRYGDDFCLQKEAVDFDYADPIFRNEWVTEEQLRERIEEDGWDADWVDETCKHKGSAFYDSMDTAQYDELKDFINIVWCYKAETNDRGETVRYVIVLSLADGSAFGKRVIRSRRGKWNMAFFRREVISRKLLTSRGLAMLCAPDQGVAKAVRDGAANNAIVGSLPPVKAKGTRVKNALIAPFEVIAMGTNDDVTFMQPPAYPAAAKETEEKIKAELLAYQGISDGQTDVTERRQNFITFMLRQFQELFVLMVEVAQDNASDEVLAGITGEGDVKGLKREDITGSFGITLKLDPRNLDGKALIEKVQAFSGMLLNMDREGVVDTSPVVRHVMNQMWPDIAKDALKSKDEVVGRDVEQEKQNFVLIKSGVMPRMDTTGKWNYAARLQFYQQLQQENPEAIQSMNPSSQEMLNNWITALQQQQTQFGENAQIGRTGVEAVQG